MPAGILVRMLAKLLVGIVSFVATVVGLVLGVITLARLPHASSTAGGVFEQAKIMCEFVLVLGLIAGAFLFGFGASTHRLRVAVWSLALVGVGAALPLVFAIGEPQANAALVAVAVLATAFTVETAIRRRRSVKRCPDCAERVNARANVCRFCRYRFNVPDSPAGMSGQPGIERLLAVSPSALSRHRSLVDGLNKLRKPQVAGWVAACVGVDHLRIVHEMLNADGEEQVASVVQELVRVYDVSRTPMVSSDGVDPFDRLLNELLAPPRPRYVWARRAHWTLGRLRDVARRVRDEFAPGVLSPPPWMRALVRRSDDKTPAGE